MAAFHALVIQGEKELLTGKQELHDRHALLAEDAFVVGDEREAEGMQRADVFHRAWRVGIMEGLVLRVEVPPRTHHILEHVVQGRVEGGERVLAAIAEAAYFSRHLLEGLAERLVLSHESQFERVLLSGLEVRFLGAKQRGEDQRLRFTVRIS